MHSIICRRKRFSHPRPLRRRRLVKTLIGQDRLGFAVALHHPTSTLLLTSRTRKAWTFADSQSRRAILETLWTAQDPMAIASTTMARKGYAARIRTAVDHSRISKRICSPINQRDLRSAQSRPALIIRKASLANTTRIAIPSPITKETWSVDSAQGPAQPPRRASIAPTSSNATLPLSMA